MPRLTNYGYLDLQHWLTSVWRDSRKSFGLLSLLEQRYLHDYFVPSWQLKDEDLLRYRAKIGAEQPNLPAVAGRAASRLQKKMAEQQPLVPTPPAGKRRVVVKAVIHPKPNEDLMSRALLRIMQDLEDQDSDKLAS